LSEYQALLPQIWSSGILTNGGPYVRELERRLAQYLPARNVAAITNGTVALQLALRAVGGSKGVVITTPFTFAATTTALVWEGYTPRFVDIDRDTFVLDHNLVADGIGRDVVGVLPVQVFGNPAGSRELAAVAKERARWTIFDSAHCFGVRISRGSLFNLGDASILSFHATKSFHTFEGGAVVTPRRGVARRVELLRNFGLEVSGNVSDPGINGKMTEPHAAMGLVNLRYVDRWIRARELRVRLYRDLLSSLKGIEFQHLRAARQNYIYMPILLPTRRLRDRVYQHLYRSGIRPRVYYLVTNNRFGFLPRALQRECPVAQEISSRVLCLPLYHELPLGSVRRVVDGVREALE
jgi:dTDP-4-amino-4,6-dideoxygalactose transaminase